MTLRDQLQLPPFHQRIAFVAVAAVVGWAAHPTGSVQWPGGLLAIAPLVVLAGLHSLWSP